MKIFREHINKGFASNRRNESETYDDLRKRRPLPNETNEGMRHTPPGRKLVEDRASWNSDKFPPNFRLLLNRIVPGFVASEIVVPILYGFGFVEFIVLGDGCARTFGAGVRWNRDFAFFTCGDEVTKVSSVCTVELIFQSLIGR